MPNDSKSNDQAQERINCATTSSVIDKKLLDTLARAGYSEEFVIQMVDGFRQRLEQGVITCTTVNNEIRRAFSGKRNKRSRDLAIRFRVAMQNWINLASPFPHPPTLEVQQLPPVRSETLKRYFNLVERLHKRDVDHKAPDLRWGAKEDDAYEYARYAIESDSPGATKSIEIDQNMENAKAILCDYINRSEENALEVLVYILNLEDDELIVTYNPLIVEVVERLSGNPVFIRCLFNLFDENAYRDNPVCRIADSNNTLILNALMQAGVVHEYYEGESCTNNVEPRDFQYHSHVHTGKVEDAEDIETEFRLKIPSNYLPLHWNGTRLVNPCLNTSFQEFAKILKEDVDKETDKKEEEKKKYIDEIENNRRYTLDFERMNIMDIPGTEDMDIWFNYYQDEDMEPTEMQVEVMVNDASIIYHIKNGVCYMRREGNMVPRLLEEEMDAGSNHLDALYGKPNVQQWASLEAQNNLSYYLLKYAHVLFVLPRSVGKKSESSKVERENRFNLRLREHSTEARIPNGEGGTRRVVMHHFKTGFSTVAGHIRKLPEGQRPSPEAVAEADKYNIRLLPGQTFVKEHTRGSELTEQGRSGKGRHI